MLSVQYGPVIKFRAERKKSDEKKGGDTNVTVEQGNASGRDTNIGGDVIYGADGRQLGQALAEAQKSLLDWVKQLSAENAELVRRLEQGRVGPQTPGTELAVGEAVQSIAQRGGRRRSALATGARPFEGEQNH